MEDLLEYSHSPVHMAVIRHDHATLRHIFSSLPNQPNAGEITTVDESIAAELQSDATSAVIDRRDVPGGETPLYLSVRLRDTISVEILMAAGADWSLENQSGWNPLQEAVCRKEEEIIKIIARHLHPQAIAKLQRRLPRIVASVARVRDFYMEIEFHFESLVIPFISRIAPSDTYKIWKIGSNLRVDMTMIGFDGFRIQRRDQSYVFLGEERRKQGSIFLGSDNRLVLPRGAVVVLDHGKKEISDALEGPTESELDQQVAVLRKTLRYRAGVDVTQAELAKSLDWSGRERTEMVGDWEAKVYDILHVMLSVRSRGTVIDDDVADAIDRLAYGGDNDDGKKKKRGSGETKNESEYKKSLRPCLWLTSDFPLETEELLPLLDILAEKVKAVRRLRELLTTKLPYGTFPVKLAVPIIPTVKVVFTFTKFKELKPAEEFPTPPSSPTQNEEGARCNEYKGSTSWISWMSRKQSGDGGKSRSLFRDENDPFHIPSDYACVDANEKERKIRAENQN